MKIEINKKYKTMNDLEYICYWVGEKEVHGAIIKEGKRGVIIHTIYGEYSKIGLKHELDLIEVKEKKQLTGFVNIYPNRVGGRYDNKESANDSAGGNRIACIDLSQYNILYEEGEGL